jgi:hypothetical protein
MHKSNAVLVRVMGRVPLIDGVEHVRVMRCSLHMAMVAAVSLEHQVALR